MQADAGDEDERALWSQEEEFHEGIWIGSEATLHTSTKELPRRALRHRRCGWRGHGHAMRPCPDNDTYCGHWNGRFWAPIGCEYDDVRPHEAR